MMRSLIAIAALVASVSASAGELDGKRLMCVANDKSAAIEWYRFDDGKVIRCYVYRDGATAKSKCRADDPYATSVSKVEWGPMEYRHQIDRKSLELTAWSGPREDRLMVWQAQCSIPASTKAWDESIADAVRLRQRELDEQMKDNKI